MQPKNKLDRFLPNSKKLLLIKWSDLNSSQLASKSVRNWSAESDEGNRVDRILELSNIYIAIIPKS